MATNKSSPPAPRNDRNCGCFDCCNDIRDIVACVCSLDKEFECVEGALGHCDNQLKAKVLTCVILRQISQLDAKLDRILHCLHHKDWK